MTQENKSYLLIGLFFFAVIALVLVGRYFPVGADGSPKEDKSSQAVIEKKLKLGGATNYGIVCVNEEGDNPLCIGGASGTITTATSTGAWRNLTGQEVWVDYTEMTPSGNASSSMYFVAGTSSTNSLANDFAGFVLSSTRGQLLIASTSVATNTRPVITNSNWFRQATSTILRNPSSLAGADRMSFGGDGRTGVPVDAQASTSVRVANGEYVLFLVRAAAQTCLGNQGPAAGAAGQSCEAATTTGRGNVLWKLRYHY